MTEETIFAAALDKEDPAERSAYLDAACAGNPALRQRIEALLRSHQDASGFLQEPIARPVDDNVPTLGLEDKSAASLPPGSTIRYFGDYELLEVIAHGGMGVVYRARQVSLNRIVALKMIRAGELASSVDVQRFKTEAEAAANLDHPNIVPIFEVGDHQGLHYFSMKLIEGSSLAKWSAECRVRKEDGKTGASHTLEAASLLATVARAVHHAHQRGILHRDLKPANILLQHSTPQPDIQHPASEIPIVTDFGLAKRVEGESGMTQTGSIVGTPSYMAPEQARAEKQLTTGVDVYSLGAILYELLTGRPPFLGETVMETLLQVLEKEPVDPRRVNPKADRDLAVIAMKCLNKDPARRYESAAALADDLERWVREEPILARQAGRMERTRKWLRRNKELSAGLALAVLVLLAGTAVSTWQAVQARIAENNEATQRRAAEVALKTADEQRDRAEVLVYIGKLALAQHEFQDGNLGLALDLLNQCQVNLRGWEHRYLTTRFNAPQTLRGHTNPVWCVCYNRDGKRLATASWDGTVKIWDSATGENLLTLRHTGPNFRVMSVCFSPNGKLVASTGWQLGDAGVGETKIWNAETGAKIFDLKGDDARAASVCFSPDSKLLASAGVNGTMTVWDAEKGEKIISIKAYTYTFDCVCFSPDGKCLASSGVDAAKIKRQDEFPAAVKVWDVGTWQQIQSFKVMELLSGYGRKPTQMTFSPDGKTLAVATLGGGVDGISILDAETGKAKIPTIQTQAFDVCFSPDGKRLASGDVAGNVRVWDAESGRQILLIRGHVYQVNSVCFSPDGERLASAGANEVKVWNAKRGQEVISLAQPEGHVNSLAFSFDGKRLAAAEGKVDHYSSGGNGVRIWDLEHNRLLWEKYMAATGVCWRQPGDGKEKGINIPDESPASVVCFRPGGKELVLAGGGTAKYCDAETGKTLRVFKGMTPDVLHLCFSPDGKLLATGGGDLGNRTGEVKIWDADTGVLVFNLEGHSGPVESVCFSPDGKLLASASWDHTVKIWDTDTGKEIRTLQGHTEWVTCVCFSPDGKRLATASGDKTLKVWDAATGNELLTLLGHSARVRCVCFHPDGTRLASCSDDQTVKVWDAQKGLEVLTLKGFGFWVTSVRFSSDGEYLAAGGGAEVKVWQASSKPSTADVD